MKKFVTVLLGIVMLMSLECASTVWIVRNIISKDNIKFMLEKADVLDKLYDEINADVKDVIDEEEVANEMISIAVDEFYYKIDSNNKKPNLDKLEELIDEAADKYEKKTGKKVDRPDVSELITELDEEYDEMLEGMESENLTFILDVFFKNTLIFIAIGIIIACLILIFVIRKDFTVVLFHTGLVSLLNGFYTGLITIAFKLLASADEEFGIVFGNTFHISGAICMTFIIVGIVSLVASIVLKKQNNTITTTKSPVTEQPIQ